MRSTKQLNAQKRNRVKTCIPLIFVFVEQLLFVKLPLLTSCIYHLGCQYQLYQSHLRLQNSPNNHPKKMSNSITFLSLVKLITSKRKYFIKYLNLKIMSHFKKYIFHLSVSFWIIYTGLVEWHNVYNHRIS